MKSLSIKFKNLKNEFRSLSFWILLIITLLLATTSWSQNVQTVWKEDWEGNWKDNWGADFGTWDAGVPTSGPMRAIYGKNVAATVLAGNYTENVTSRFIRITPFVVPNANENPRLRFWHWYSISSDDYGYVQIKVSNGTWENISTSYAATSSSRWTYTSIDLTPYAGSTVQIAFYFVSRQTNYYGTLVTTVSSGWYIDDVAVIKGPITYNNPEGWEIGIGDWSVERGTWEVGRPSSGPGSAHSDTNCAATVLSGNYEEWVDSRLTSPPFVVPTASKIPLLRFWHWYSFSSDDDGYVQIKIGKKGEWKTVLGPYTNTSGGIWTYPFYDLSSYADSTIQVAFYFTSRQTNNYGTLVTTVSSGWYVDDILITGKDITNQPKKVTVPNVATTVGEIIYIPIQVDNASDIAGGAISMTYNSNILTALSAKTTSLTSGFTLADTISPGKIAISLARATPIFGGSGSLVDITFKVNSSARVGDTTSLVLKNVSLFDTNTSPISVTTQNGLFTVGDSGSPRIIIAPKSSIVGVGQTINFLATAQNITSVNPNWSVTGGIGTVAPVTGATTTFTATAVGNGRVIATQGSLTDTATVTIGILGDVNSDRVVDVRDAIIAMRIIVGGLPLPPIPPGHTTPTAYERWAADFNGNGTVNEADALLILIKSLGGLLKSNLFANYEKVQIRVANFEISNEYITVPILVNQRSDIYAAGVHLSYDAELLTLVEVTPGVASSLFAANMQQVGQAKISLINADGVVGSQGEIVRLKFKKLKEISDYLSAISLNHVNMFGAQANALEVEVLSGKVKAASLPRSYSLMQNYPNPFNPETRITFQLPYESAVKLTVYNLSGQLLRILLDERVSAGEWTVAWDGKDKTGNAVPSGVYLYQLIADNGAWTSTKKMVLMR